VSGTEHCDVVITNSDEAFPCYPGETLLKAMERLGRKGIPVGCRNGGCGICKVEITDGYCGVGKMSRAHISEEEEQAGIVLACRCYPITDVRVEARDKLAYLMDRFNSAKPAKTEPSKTATSTTAIEMKTHK